VALAITSQEGARFGVATDLGYVPPALAPFLGACDAALVEANYCPAMLSVGPYPEHLRRRIRGGLGHLANEQVADLAAELGSSRLARLYLGHISRSNNSPERALAVVTPHCKGFEVEAVPHGSSRVIDVVRCDSWDRRRRMGEQLALAFG
jgi:phosphoribosyl 1,2-cyclic phosphodiesterase